MKSLEWNKTNFMNQFLIRIENNNFQLLLLALSRSKSSKFLLSIKSIYKFVVILKKVSIDIIWYL